MKKILLLIFIPLHITLAETFELLSDLPLTQALESQVTADGSGLGVFVNFLYQASIAIGAALAVIMLIWAGVRYATSVIPGAKNDAKEHIIGALGGLLLLLSTYIILNQVNPDLVKLGVERQTVDGRGEAGGILGTAIEGTAGLERNEDGTFVENADDEYSVNDPIGEAPVIPRDSGFIKDEDQPIETAVVYETRDECIRATEPGSEVAQDDPTICPGFDTSSLSGPGFTGDGPTVSQEILSLPKNHKDYVNRLTPDVAQRIGWPVNPHRRPKDFASKDGGGLRISRTAVEADRILVDEFLKRFGKPLRLVSAYRTHAHNSASGSKANNHQLGFSLDYGMKEFNQQELEHFQDLILEMDVVRIGWGRSNNAGTHIQWDDKQNRKFIFWCYQRGTGPHKRNDPRLKNWTKGSSCNWR